MFPYQNKCLTIRERVSDLTSRMTLQEKIGQVNQKLYGWTIYSKDGHNFQLSDNFKKHVAWGGGLGALYGLFRADPWSQKDYRTGISASESYKLSNQVQQYVISHSRLGIPTLLVEEAPHGHQGLGTVSYPTNLGKSNCFDTDLIRESASIQAEELLSKGINIALVSTLDLLKDPRWGRSEETFGESPLLTSKYTQAVIDGFQGNLISDNNFLDKPVPIDAKQHVGVVIKHLIGQGESLGGHNSGTVPIGDREFNDIYGSMIPSLKYAVGVMAAYNDIDGIPCHANRVLLNDLLRVKNNFQGLVMADGTALDRLTSLYGNPYDAGYSALKAGVDLSLWDDVYTKLSTTAELNDEVIKYLDNAVKHVLSIKFLLGLFDDPYVTPEQSSKLPEILKKGKKNNLQIATSSITLVKNDIINGNPILPLENKKELKIAAIGPHVDDIYTWLGDYTAPQLPEQYVNLSTALRDYTSNIETAHGSDIRKKQSDNHQIESAITIAQKSDVIILTLGGSSARNFDMSFLSNGALKEKDNTINTDTGENVDVASLTLGGDQLKLLRALKSVDKPIITIMVQGRPYDIREVVNLSDAVLIAWYPGQQGPQAVTDIIFGKSMPTGKLSISYPRNSEQLPVYYYQRDVLKNENYFDEPGTPLFKFGYGLTYFNVAYKNLTVYTDKTKGLVKISIEVENKNTNIVDETILLFGRMHGTNILPRKKQLFAFKKVSLYKKSSSIIYFKLSYSELTYTDQQLDDALPKKIEFTTQNLHQIIEL